MLSGHTFLSIFKFHSSYKLEKPVFLLHNSSFEKFQCLSVYFFYIVAYSLDFEDEVFINNLVVKFPEEFGLNRKGFL